MKTRTRMNEAWFHFLVTPVDLVWLTTRLKQLFQKRLTCERIIARSQSIMGALVLLIAELVLI